MFPISLNAWHVVPGYGAQSVVVVQPGKQVLVPALFMMHQVVPGQSFERVQTFVHQRLLQVPSGQASPCTEQAEPIGHSSTNAQARFPLSSPTQHLLSQPAAPVQCGAQKFPRAPKSTQEALSVAASQH